VSSTFLADEPLNIQSIGRFVRPRKLKSYVTASIHVNTAQSELNNIIVVDEVLNLIVESLTALRCCLETLIAKRILWNTFF